MKEVNYKTQNAKVNGMLPVGASPSMNKMMKTKRGQFVDKSISDDDANKYLAHGMRFWGMTQVDLNDPDEIAERTKKYFEACIEDNIKPCIEMYCYCLGVDRSYLLSLVYGNNKQDNDTIIHKVSNGRNTYKSKLSIDLLKKSVNFISSQLSLYMYDGKINPIVGMFFLKNNHLYTDKTEIDINNKSNMLTENDKDTIAEKYVESVVVDD